MRDGWRHVTLGEVARLDIDRVPDLGWRFVPGARLDRTPDAVLVESEVVAALVLLNPLVAEDPGRVDEVLPRLRATILSVNDGDLRPIAERVKQVFREGDQPRRNVFLARAYEDEDEVNLLRAQAKNPDTGLEFNDWSLRHPFDSEQAEYIKRGIRERIRPGIGDRRLPIASLRGQPMGGLGDP